MTEPIPRNPKAPMPKKSKPTKIDTTLGAAYKFHPEPGQIVKFRPWSVIGDKMSPVVPYSFPIGMRYLCGKVVRVKSVDADGEIHLVERQRSTDCDEWTYSRQMFQPATKAYMRAFMKLRALENAKEAKKRADRAAALKKLPAKARKALKYLQENPVAFGCQREHVVALLSLILDADLAKLVKP